MLWNKSKKTVAMLLAGVMLAGSLSPIQNVKAEVSTGAGITENFNGSVGTDNLKGGKMGDLTLSIVDGEGVDGTKALLASNRPHGYEGYSYDLSAFAGKEIQVNARVKLVDRQVDTDVKATLKTTQQTQEDYLTVATVSANSLGYAHLTGTYQVPEGKDTYQLYFETAANINYYLDDVNINVLPSIKEDFDAYSAVSEVKGFVFGSPTLSLIDDNSEGKKLQVSGRTENYMGYAYDVSAFAGNTIQLSAEITTYDADAAARAVKATIQSKDKQPDAYNQVASVQLTGNETQTLAGEYKIPTGWGTYTLYFETDTGVSYQLDDVSITVVGEYINPAAEEEEPETGETKEKATIAHIQSLTPVREAFKEDGIEKAGVCLPLAALTDETRMALVSQHYNSVTCENEMKPEAFLNNATIEGEKFTLDFSTGDQVADALLAYNAANPDKEPILMRGHVLVWHSQTPTWFFRENFDSTGAYVDKATMNARLESYIKQVMEHYYGENKEKTSKYANLLYAWDVVNEQASDGDPSGLRMGTDWAAVYKGSDEYITNAFVYANKYAPEDVKLYYNDYNDTTPAKVAYICELLTKIKGTANARIDGMGMQGHYNMYTPSVEELEAAVRAYSKIVAEVQSTELDFKGTDDYDGKFHDTEYALQGWRYKEVYDKFVALNKESGINVTGITFWGTDDGNSWLNEFNGAGGGGDGKHKVCPLLFDKYYFEKPAYWAIVDPTQLPPMPPVVKSTTVNQAEKVSDASVVTYAADDLEIRFAPIWSAEQLKVKVTVKDADYDETDGVKIFADLTNSRKAGADIIAAEVKREDTRSVAGGYEATLTLDGTFKLGDKIGFDIRVTDGDVQASWSDTTNSQDTSSLYYGHATFGNKVMYVRQGSPASADDVAWDTASPLNLTIAGGAEATASAQVLWDKDSLYVRMQVKDAHLDDTSSDAYQQDSVEIFVDENNNKTAVYEADDKQYRINYKNVVTINPSGTFDSNITSTANVTEDGYVVYAKLLWSSIEAAENTLVGLELQINDGRSGARIGTLNLFDSTGMGYQNTSAYGTAKLVKDEPVDLPEADAYKAKVVNGLGSAFYEAGKTVTVTAKTPPAGQVFDKWTSDSDVVFADATKATTTFVMPAKAVTVTALYKAISTGEVPKDPGNTGDTGDTSGNTQDSNDSQAQEVKYFAKFSVKSVPLQKGKTTTAIAKDLQIAKGDKVVKWTTSNKKIATVTKSGKVKAIKKGNAKITATTQSGKKATITVKVQNGKVTTKKLTVKNQKTGKTIKNGKTVTLQKNAKLQLTAVRNPITSPQKVTYKTSNKKVATINSKGKITAKKKGTVTITVQSGKKTVKFKVKVK